MNQDQMRQKLRAYAMALMATIDGPVVIGEEVGPYPAAHDPRFAGRMQHE